MSVVNLYLGAVRGAASMDLQSALASVLERLGVRVDNGAWLRHDILVCADPTSKRALRKLARDERISVLINLRERPHNARRLAQFGLREIHIPVPDKAAPSGDQLSAGIAAIEQTVAKGQRVAVHCRNGRGRSGTLLACYLVRHDRLPSDQAIAHVRAVRPGAIETQQQASAVRAYAETQLRRTV
jgi:atypical dual specificity phosphatase